MKRIVISNPRGRNNIGRALRINPFSECHLGVVQLNFRGLVLADEGWATDALEIIGPTSAVDTAIRFLFETRLIEAHNGLKEGMR